MRYLVESRMILVTRLYCCRKIRAISDRLIVQMKDFVKGSVSDAVINLDIKAGNIRQGDSLRIVDRVYKAAFEIMVSAGENE